MTTDHLAGRPVPLRRRWQPLRAGLVDLYYYDDQEFWFHDGRLLLRGNNGAGKSKVLALLLPFLLDGETGGHRLEPDGDAAKRMEWNLLLGGEHPSAERTGYSWLELGRLDADGVAHHRTIGFGVKAARGRGVVKRWFFTAAARVGVDLHLVDATRTVLTQERLEAALEGRGRVTTTARAHRAAVDELFFGLGEARYAALVDLLVQLRQPQLSRRPSEARLSEALSAALPPLDPAVLSDVAETYRSLEEDRTALARTRAAHAGARSFLGHYRDYARVAARRAARPPREAQSRHDQNGRDLAEARRALDGAESTRQEAGERARAAGDRVEVLRARELALAGDPRHRSVEVVDAARQADDAAAREVGDAQRRAQDARRRSERAASAAEESHQRQQGVLAAATRLATDAGAAAVGAGLPALADLAAGAAEPFDVTAPPPDLGPWRRAAEVALARRRRDLDHVDSLTAAQRDLEGAAAAAAREADRADAALSRAEEACAAAEEAQREAGAALVAATTTWLSGLVELRVADPAALLSDVEAWLVALEGPGPGPAVATAARDAAVTALTVEREHRRREGAQARDAAAALAEELAALERGEHTPPAPPPTRDPAAREDAVGAPLWQLVEPAPGLGEAAAAGLEAALEAAGLLDAWVGADASLRLADDVVVHPGAAAGPGRSLAQVLVAAPPPGSPVPAGAVTAVLGSIGLGDPEPPGADGQRGGGAGPGVGGGAGAGVVWVDVDGRFGTPVSTGSWHRARSEHLGAASRERRRAARTVAVRSELAQERQRELDADDAAEALTGRLRQAAREADGVPGAAGVLRAAQALATLVGQRSGAREAARAADLARDTATEAAAGAAAATDAAAAELALPAEVGQRAVVREAVDAGERALLALVPGLEAVRRARGEAQDRLRTAAEDAAAAADAAQELSRRRGEAAAAAERHAVLQRTLGQESTTLLAERQAVVDDQRAASQEQRAAQAGLTHAAERHGGAQDRVRTLTGAGEESAAARAAAAGRWQAFAATGVLAVAVPDVDLPVTTEPWAPDPAVRLARAVEAALERVDAGDEALSRAQNRVTGEQRGLDDVLAEDGHRAWLRVEDEQLVVDVVFRGRTATLVELEAALGEDVEQRTSLLDAREREVIENYLVDEVASTLADLVTAAEAQVDRMNTELAARPTTTGMRLRLRWLAREDAPPGLEAARQRLLRQHADAWSATDRAAVAAFLTGQVQAVRAADPGGSWLDQLAHALDYRAWHRFAVLRWQGGQWRSAAGPASGGERVLAASVPLFAAASAHYGSAPNPDAPRLVMLDEAFAGVDDTARADYLGLLAAFDLDVVMTSEREWGCYPQVPGLGIAQLSRLEGVDAVLVTPWRWDGQRRERMDAVAPARPAPPAPRAGADTSTPQDGLFE